MANTSKKWILRRKEKLNQDEMIILEKKGERMSLKKSEYYRMRGAHLLTKVGFIFFSEVKINLVLNIK